MKKKTIEIKKEEKGEQKKHVVFITGAAGYVGEMLTIEYLKRPDVREIICLDKENCPVGFTEDPRITYVQANTADYSWVELVREKKPDIVIHTAWQIREMYGKKDIQWRWNVDGSENVFKFAFSTSSVKKLVHFSTVSSYAAYPENTFEERFTEEDFFRSSDYLYAIEKKVVEEKLKRMHNDHIAYDGGVEVAVVRPAAITGPRGRFGRTRFGLQSALSGRLDKKKLSHKLVTYLVSFVPVTPKWARQFVHEDDVTDIVALMAFSPLKKKFEIINMCPPGDFVKGEDMARAVGKRILKIKPWMVRIAFFLTWNLSLGAIPTSRGGWKAYSYPVLVDGSKVTRDYGYEYKYLSKEAFVLMKGRYEKIVTSSM